jgi:small subunit ribosomal protein S6
MNKYEALVIVQNDLEDEQKEQVLARITNAITAGGGEVLDINKWGTKRFAYEIDYKREGYYVLINFASDVAVPKEIERQVKITPELTRVMILKKENN